MKIKKINTNKKQYIDLLLLADEEEDAIDRYLERGIMYALYDDDDIIAVCVVTDEGDGVLELKNIAVKKASQKNGYGKALINFITQKYKCEFRILQVGTGDVPSILDFYQKCGFHKTHKIKNFFIDNYQSPVFEEGIQLVDMIYLQKNL